jgi:GAF domain-containing protein
MPEHGAPFPDAAVAALERLGSMTLRNQSMDSVLQTVVDLAVTVLPGTPDSSITLLTRGRPVTVVSTGQLALDLDERQYEQGHGPCLHCASTGELTEVADARTDPRWRDYLPAAVERGCLSSLSVPLQIDDRVSGALNVYAREPHAFDETGRRVALRFAPYAAVAVANMQAYQDARDMADNLHAALESRAVIDQAKGILMERFKLTADQAFQALAEVSMRTNTKAQLVAQQLVRTGEFDVRALRRR